MSFDSLAFGIFFFITYAIYWVLPRDSWRSFFLTMASFFFYGFWDYRYVALMLFVIAVAFVTALKIANSDNIIQRKRWLILGVGLHLSVLFYFKYVNFFLGSFNGLSEILGFKVNMPLPNVLLPVGISFFTFHAISYTVDVFYKKVSVEPAFFRVALYIAFFPQLIAGPIVRSSFFLPQLQNIRLLDSKMLGKGMQQFLMGFLFKTVFADNLAGLADPVFNEPEKWDSAGLWVGCLAYYAQIYFDFAGYSLMAIGCALWFGYQLPDNFAWPYSSTSVTEFWRRWHISLSSWLRDYLYYPLGGNRYGPLFTYRNLMLTMIIGGLWHGASWNFIIWGGLHGMALVIHKIWSIYVISTTIKKSLYTIVLSWLVTQAWIFIAWIFFRSSDFSNAIQILVGLFGVKEGGKSLSLWFVPTIFFLLFTDALLGRFKSTNAYCLAPSMYAVLAGVIFAIMLWLKPLSTVPFIYFQF